MKKLINLIVEICHANDYDLVLWENKHFRLFTNNGHFYLTMIEEPLD